MLCMVMDHIELVQKAYGNITQEPMAILGLMPPIRPEQFLHVPSTPISVQLHDSVFTLSK